MTKNLFRLWVALLFITGGIALWYSSFAVVGVWNYVRLNAQTQATVLHLQVKDLSSSRFAIEADYRFEVRGSTFKGKTIFESPQFLNRFAADNYIKLQAAARWSAWYNLKNPTISSLEKEFPQKYCLQALLTVGVFAYFYFAKSLLARMLD